MYVQQAVVLVGGKGKRLGDLTRTTPKPLLEIAPGIRFLDITLFEIARHGFSDIVLLAGHLGEAVEQAYQNKRILDSTVHILREHEPQGTGGALLVAAEQLHPWFLMANGDSLFDINLRELTRAAAPASLARIALRTVSDAGRFGAVETAGERITAFREKSSTPGVTGLINGGIYCVSRDILSHIAGPCSIERDVFPLLAERGQLTGQEFDGYFLDIGLPNTYEQARQELPQRMERPCAFLDRDGVLNHDSGYTHKPGDLRWMPNAREAVRLLNDSGFFVVVVTNQAGVGRGYFEEKHVHEFHGHMAQELADVGAHIDAFYHCPFHEEAAMEMFRAANHPDRKPNPGMIRRAMNDLPIRHRGSFMIGDRDSDELAAKAAGLDYSHYAGGNLEDLVRSMMQKRGDAS